MHRMETRNDLDPDKMDVGELISRSHCFKNEGRVYHISIIDYFQKWDMYKKGERFTKTIIMQKNGANLSAIEPQKYAKRFIDFMEGCVFD